MEIARKIAQRVQESTYETLDASVRDRTKYLLLDYLGVAIRGSRTDSSQLVSTFSLGQPCPRRRRAGHRTTMRAEAPFAALANGAAAHSLELDDVVNAASLHPGVTIMPAALSAGCIVGCSGRELIEGIVAGYELTVKLGIALDPAAHYAQGFHPTGTCGALGSALAAAKILKLDADQTARAIGIAGSQAAGSLEFLADGSFTKRLHAGWAAHAGLIAALLAREGFTGPASIIEGRLGFLHAYSPASDPEKVLAGWGEPYEIMKTSIKPHACCRYKQGSIDCILGIVRDNDLTAEDIEKVEASILKAGAALVAEPRESKLSPESIVDAQFSMPFGAAVAIIHGRAFLDQYCAENNRLTKSEELDGAAYSVSKTLKLKKNFRANGRRQSPLPPGTDAAFTRASSTPREIRKTRSPGTRLSKNSPTWHPPFLATSSERPLSIAYAPSKKNRISTI